MSGILRLVFAAFLLCSPWAGASLSSVGLSAIGLGDSLDGEEALMGSGELGSRPGEEIFDPWGVSFQDAAEVFAGYDRTFFKLADGRLVAAGMNNDSQLALPHHVPSVDVSLDLRFRGPFRGHEGSLGSVPAPDDAFFVQVACGRRFSVFVDSRGRVWAAGVAPFLLEALGSERLWKLVRLEVEGNPVIRQAAASSEGLLLLTSAGDVLVAGSVAGHHGLPGPAVSGTGAFRKLRSGLPAVRSIACGEFHCLLLTLQGSVFGLGLLEADTEPHWPRRVAHLPVELLRGDVQEIAAGHRHSLFLLRSQQVMAMGSNRDGRLGLPEALPECWEPTMVPTVSHVKQIAAGSSHSVFVSSQGTVWVAGANNHNQIGLSCASAHNGAMSLPRVRGVRHVACGAWHTILLTDPPHVKSEIESEKESLVEPEMETLMGPGMESEMESESELEPKSESEMEPKSESEMEPKPEAEPPEAPRFTLHLPSGANFLWLALGALIAVVLLNCGRCLELFRNRALPHSVSEQPLAEPEALDEFQLPSCDSTA